MKIAAILFLASPAAAQPMGMPPGPGSCDPMTGTLVTAAIYAILAAIGYWVLQHADKETHSCVRRTGATVGTLLVLFGLAGFLCGVVSHIKKTASSACSCGGGHAGMMGERRMLPPGPPPAGMMPGLPGQQPPAKPGKTEAGAAKSSK